MSKRFIESVNGINEYMVHDAATDTIGLVHECDLTDQLDLNRQTYNDDTTGFAGTDFKRVAAIPEIAIEIYTKIYGANPMHRGNEKLLERMLNDPDLRHFRTAPGRIVLNG